MIFALASAAFACEPLGPQLDAARAAVDDAELAQARALIDAAYRSLPCQEERVATESLLSLYRLDGVVALAADDRARAVYAVLRVGAIDPLAGIVAAEDGPELASLFQTYANPLADGQVAVRVDDGGTAWLDGRAVRSGASLRVAKGEHLLQIEGPTGLATSVEEISADRDLHTGSEARPSEPLLPPTPAPAPQPLALPSLQPVPATRRTDVASRIGWITGLALGAAGGAVLGVAWRSEDAFNADSYQAATYGGCASDEACWATARTAAIRSDAQRVRLFYATGYGLAGAGGALFLGGVTGAAVRVRPGIQVGGVW